MSDLDAGYHYDVRRMHHYDMDLVFEDWSGTETICTLGRVDHRRDTKHMLCDTFPQFPKSHWQCFAPYMRDGTYHNGWTGLWIRVHHTADFDWRHWDTWRLWRPWREWSETDTREKATEVAMGFKERWDDEMQ